MHTTPLSFKSNSEPALLDQLPSSPASIVISHTSHLQSKYFSSQTLDIIDHQNVLVQVDHHPKDSNTKNPHSTAVNKIIDEQDFSNFNYSYEALVNHKQIYSIFKQYLLTKKMEEAVEFLESVKHYRLICRKTLVACTPSSFTPNNSILHGYSNVMGKNRCSTASVVSVSSSVDSHEYGFHHHADDESSHDDAISSLTFLDVDSDEIAHNGIMIPHHNSDNHSDSSSSFISFDKIDKLEKVANSVVETFICNVSPKELNLPHALKEKTIQSFKRMFHEHHCQVESPENLFRNVEMFIHESLKLNYFHAFMKSDIFHNFLIKSGKTIDILHEIGTLKDGIEYMAVESMADMKNQNFSLSDFAFLKRKVFCGDAVNSREWVLAVNQKNYKCFFTKDKFDFGNSVGLKFFKFEILFPYTVEQVLKTFTNQDYRQKIDEYIYDIQTVKYVEEPKIQGKDKLFTSVINLEKYKLIWPIKDREIIVCSSSVYDRVSNLHIIGFKSCDSFCLTDINQESTKNKSKKSKIIRACVVGGWFFESISENQTMFHEIYYIDMKGSIPKLMMDKVITNRASKFYKLGLKYLKENEKNGFPTPQRDASLYRLFKENGDIHLR